MDKNIETRKGKLARFWALITVLGCIIVGVGVTEGSDLVLPLFLAVGGVMFGPVCGVMYLIEIRKGVFAMNNDEEEQEGFEEK